MLQICAEHSVDNIEIFIFIADQSSHRAKASSVFYTAALARKLWVHGKLGGNTERTGIFQSIWQHVQYIKLGEEAGKRGDIWSDGACLPK